MTEPKDAAITRRQVVAFGLGAAALASLPAASADSPAEVGPTPEPAPPGPGPAPRRRMPVAYVPHGGGPWPFVDLGFPVAETEPLAAYLRGLPRLTSVTPTALLVISAHWEMPAPTVMTSPRPPMLYDYYGFPPESYQVTWPAPGEPKVASRVRTLLDAAGIQTAEDPSRGFDHGTFVPLKLAYPNASIPTVQLSLQTGLDPARHLAIGRALQPLRNEGVFIIGSGMSYHNMRAFNDPRAGGAAVEFDTWLRATTTAPAAARDRGLTAWAQAPSARAAHPREEHLLPLMVIAGAAGADTGTLTFQGHVFGKAVSGYHFG